MLGACASPVGVSVTHNSASAVTAIVPAAKIQVFDAGARIEKPYDIIGRVSTMAFGLEQNRSLQAQCIEQMKTEAAKLGANAIIGLYTIGNKHWADGTNVGFFNMSIGGAIPESLQGLAVRFLEPGQAPQNPRADFIIQLLDLEITAAETGKADFAKRASYRQIQSILTTKGYYVIPYAQQAARHTMREITEATTEELDRMVSSNAALIVGLKFIKKNRSSAILVNFETDHFEAAMFSRKEGKINWNSTGDGSSSIGSLLDLMLPHEKQASAIAKAMQEMFMPTFPWRASSFSQIKL